MAGKLLTALDLFCGAGGLTEGLKQAGFSVLGGVEINPVAARTYRMNHNESHCFEVDIRNLEVCEILDKLNIKEGELDLLAGCPPCQGFSTLRTRKKMLAQNDDRNELIFEFLRLIKGLKPKAIMMENVPALAKDFRMEIFISELKKLGYLINESTVKVENAADYGVPQRRKRMIVKTSRVGEIPTTKIVGKRITVRECFNKANLGKSGTSGDWLHDYSQTRSTKVMEIIKAIPKDGGSRKDLPDHLILDCHKKRPAQFNDVYGRMKWDDVSPTITGGCSSPSKGRFLHPEEDRCITLREASLLQTFPKDYIFPTVAKTDIALLIGNALPPEFIRQHALNIKEALEIK
ncbi:DNA cytosine methyltransferase [Acinetobacter baumannii]|uniref:DNA cytosine methyltransferase n=1 Tax=Acinetobacter baumannii TaxID=470 RepID=UPI0016613B81|nr:DNA cytosine methyltransferase [Acinetobacter baumannii]EHU1305938.1 DNA cytosine methyltransferase [Acinetobacter baumannii]EHU1428820.1 DNA cytosine methyltransferase [Acinetobacter baumannii]EHU2441740.1 DNA cytosine methyltransferase [Acinetobacter baumannii]EJB5620202.1 DNA cytosine methyltransferase [Acinetobacter baumannii]EJB8375953.1 DNA cytosine methyltransferase [Acinetobacter baumannii]